MEQSGVFQRIHLLGYRRDAFSVEFRLGKEFRIEKRFPITPSPLAELYFSAQTPTLPDETHPIARPSLIRAARPAVPTAVDDTKGLLLRLLPQLQGISHEDVDQAIDEARSKE